jgi:hypothetical protein
MSEPRSPQEWVGSELRPLVARLGAEAGIRPVLLYQTHPPKEQWQWWVKRGPVVGHGFAPSLKDARLDLRQHLNPIARAIGLGSVYEPGGQRVI